MQASGEHSRWIPVEIAVDWIKIRDEKFNWLIAVQADGEHKQRILVQIAVDGIKIREAS
jgi:hypothetical protein